MLWRRLRARAERLPPGALNRGRPPPPRPAFALQTVLLLASCNAASPTHDAYARLGADAAPTELQAETDKAEREVLDSASNEPDATRPAQDEAELDEQQRIMLVIAHPDDDLGMNPWLMRRIASGATVLTVMVTGGDAGFPCLDYTEGREYGSRAAYAKMAGVPDVWDEQLERWADNTVRVLTLRGANLRLAWLALPNTPVSSVAQLWQGSLASLPTLEFDVRRPAESYTREGLIATLRMAFDDFDPQVLRINDASKLWPEFWPFDHADHIYTGLFALSALGCSEAHPQVTMQRSYNIQFEAANLVEAEASEAWDVFDAYLQYDAKICDEKETVICGVTTVCDVPVLAYRPIASRSYVIALTEGRGILRAPGQDRCVAESDDQKVIVVPCSSSAPTFQTLGDGSLQNASGEKCFTAKDGPGNEVALTRCDESPEQAFWLSDMGQLRGPGASCVEVAMDKLMLAECADKPSQRHFAFAP